MTRKKKLETSPKDDTTTVRATISFPSQIYKALDGIAKQKKVSLAWVVREATEKYVDDQWPLFARLKQNE